jgi:REP element-mobilizing transposase RayT
MSDHVHILISIPPKYSVAQVVGFIKGKSAISIARTYMGRSKHFTGQTSASASSSSAENQGNGAQRSDDF